MNDRRSVRCVGWLFAVLGTILVSAGCHPQACPFYDPYAHCAAVTTASSEGAMAAETTQRQDHRSFDTVTVAPMSGAVTHGPLYFEDGFGDFITDDGTFAWTGEDFVYIFTWRGRFLANILFYPISLINTPPWQVMTSDGAASREVLWISHDAQPVATACCGCVTTPPGAEPVDAG